MKRPRDKLRAETSKHITSSTLQRERKERTAKRNKTYSAADPQLPNPMDCIGHPKERGESNLNKCVDQPLETDESRMINWDLRVYKSNGTTSDLIERGNPPPLSTGTSTVNAQEALHDFIAQPMTGLAFFKTKKRVFMIDDIDYMDTSLSSDYVEINSSRLFSKGRVRSAGAIYQALPTPIFWEIAVPREHRITMRLF
jgi:hypothetical protein